MYADHYHIRLGDYCASAIATESPEAPASDALTDNIRVTGRIGIRYLLPLLIVVMLLSACTGLRDIPVTDESYQIWATRQKALQKIDAWELQARTAIFVNKEVYQVGFNWVREPEQFVIMIQAPFGQGVFRVESNPTTDLNYSVKLTMPDGQTHFSHSAEALLSQLFGWSIPIGGLKSWIKGSPQQPETYTFELYADGRLKTLRQEGWSINYLDYFADDESEPGLPKKMYLKHRDLALKIVISRWQRIESRLDNTFEFPGFD